MSTFATGLNAAVRVDIGDAPLDESLAGMNTSASAATAPIAAEIQTFGLNSTTFDFVCLEKERRACNLSKLSSKSFWLISIDFLSALKTALSNLRLSKCFLHSGHDSRCAS